MLTLPSSVHVYVATVPTDMRKSFDGLSVAAQMLGHEPTSGHLFVFRNRRGNQVKILFWDRTGYCIFAKRLARGSFHFGEMEASAKEVTLDAAELALILEGIDLHGAKRYTRFRLAPS
jgi:transposase